MELGELLQHLHGGLMPTEPVQVMNWARSPLKSIHSDVIYFDTAPRRGRAPRSRLPRSRPLHVAPLGELRRAPRGDE